MKDKDSLVFEWKIKPVSSIPNRRTKPAFGRQFYLARESTMDLTTLSDPTTNNKNVPFRLPNYKLDKSPSNMSNRNFKSYEYTPFEENTNNLNVTVKRIRTKPTQFLQLAHLKALKYNEITSAVISPLPPPTTESTMFTKEFLTNYQSISNYNNSNRLATSSPARSIHWILPAQKQMQFDKKGKHHVQGPFSREFFPTCHPPESWLKMKLTPRQRTVFF